MQPVRLYSLVDRRQRRKLASAQSLRRRLGRLVFGCAAVLLLVLAVGTVVLSAAYASLVKDLPSLAQLPELFDPQHGALMQPTRLYDRSGQQALLSLDNTGIPRNYLFIDAKQPEHFSPELIRATLGLMDPEYWRSAGFRLGRLANPAPQTIAERLVDDLLLTQEPPGLRRALRMRILAAQVVARFGRVQVLEWYLNSAYFGHLAFGADSAARLYLDKPAGLLDMPESALLLAAVEAPALNPLDAPSAALERQNAILDELLANGTISGEEHRRAQAEPLRLALQPGQEPSPAAAFSQLVLKNLEETFGPRRVERGGMRVITTLDYSLQLDLSCLTRTQLARLSDLPDDIRLPGGGACLPARLLPTLPPGDQSLPAGIAASGVVLDPQTGQVLALLDDTSLPGASTDGSGSDESNILSPHPPGSLLTPFAAVTSFARGFGPASLVWDIPASLPENLAARTNPDGKFHGPVRLRLAIANDYLAPQAQMLSQVGAASVWRLAGALGLSSLAGETGPELIYHGGRVTPLEMAQAYGVLASLGARAGQRFSPGGDLLPATVLYVEDLQGNPLLDARQPVTQAVVSPQLAYLVHHVLADAAARWPSLGYPNPLEIGRPSGAKIGQVDGGSQVWAAGYTPQRVAVFWLGLPETGSARLEPRMVAGMWHALMQSATAGLSATDWRQPAGITRLEVCDPSGQLPTQACPEVVSELFLAGNEPTSADNLYQTFQINRETGRLATVFTPAALVDTRTFLVPPPQARDWAQAAGLPVPPSDYDAIQLPEPSANVRISAPSLFSYVSGEVAIQGTAAGEGFRSYQVLVGQGLNPENWIQVGQGGLEPVSNGALTVWDTRGQDGLYAVRLQVVRQDQTVETATLQVTVDNTAPLVHIPYPLPGQTFQLPQDAQITFQAEATDAIGIGRLAWLVDGSPAEETESAPYAFIWRATRGEHTLEVRAYDLAGNLGTSEQVPFTVK